MKLEVVEIDGELALILPPELLEQLGLAEGDEVEIDAEPSEKGMRIALKAMKTYAGALKALAT